VTERPFVLAVVCTANRFRSPLAAAVVRRHTAGLPVEVRSFAAAGPSGPAALPEAVSRARPLGVDLADHVAARLGAGDLRDADLVLGFERAHVAAAVIEAGAPRERAFTLPEFVPLAESAVVPPERDAARHARAVVAAAAAARGPGSRNGPLPELADPAGGPARGYDAAATDVAELSRRLVRALFGTDAATGGR
jgi:protein-tyrosine phosphatase